MVKLDWPCCLTSCSASGSPSVSTRSSSPHHASLHPRNTAERCILFPLGVISILSRPSSPHPELEQCPLFRPPLDTVNAEPEGGSLVSEDTYGQLECFAKHSSAAYQVLCPHPLGNTLVQSVRFSPHVLLLRALCRGFACSELLYLLPSPLIRFFFPLGCSFSNTVYSHMRMGSSRATMGARSSFCVSQGAMIWSPIRSSDHQRQQTSPGSGLPTCKAHNREPPACPAGISRHLEEPHGVGSRRLPHFVQFCARCRDPHRARSAARLSEQYSCCHRCVLFSGFPLDMPAAMRHVCPG